MGADLAQLCMEAALQSIREVLPDIDMEAERVQKNVLDSISVTSAHFKEAMKLCNPSALRETHVSIPLKYAKDQSRTAR